MRNYNEHKCDPDGTPMGVLDGPAWAAPGRPVSLPKAGAFGRVQSGWRCCGALLVECMTFPDDPERGETHTVRVTHDDVAKIEWGTSYSVPCVGAAWSLHLPCGHIKGEGCECGGNHG